MRHALLIAAALATVACRSTGDGESHAAIADETRAAVPQMQLEGIDGKTHTLADLVSKGPVFLYFVKKDCPANNKALPYYEALYTGLGKPANFVGVINLDAGAANEWKAAKKTSFPLLADPNLAWIHHFEAEASPWIIEVQRDGTPGRVWSGYGVTEVTELNEALATSNRRSKFALDTSGLPKKGTFG